MSTLRAPVPCERCASPETNVERVVVEYRPDSAGKLIEDAALYFIRCSQCQHIFETTLPADRTLA